MYQDAVSLRYYLFLISKCLIYQWKYNKLSKNDLEKIRLCLTIAEKEEKNVYIYIISIVCVY